MIDTLVACSALILVFVGLIAYFSPSYDLVIVTSHYREDLEWLRASKYPVVVYTKEGGTTPAIKATCKCQNFGKEASVYLKYIIDNYYNLPKWVAFLHGHETAWHQKLGMPILEAIDRAKKDRYGFISLNNCFIDDRNPSNQTYRLALQHWDKNFRPWLKMDAPFDVYHDCCAQFIVAKHRIQRHPKQAYIDWLELLRNSDESKEDRRSCSSTFGMSYLGSQQGTVEPFMGLSKRTSEQVQSSLSRTIRTLQAEDGS